MVALHPAVHQPLYVPQLHILQLLAQSAGPAGK